MNFETVGNLWEAGLWFTVALALAIRGLLANGPLRKLCLVMSLAYGIFGVTDIIESRTGAWWRPAWLAVLKAACIVAFVAGAIAYYRIRTGRGAAGQTKQRD